MKVLVYTKLTPMGYLRLIWPAMVLQRNGYDVEIADSDAEDTPIRWTPKPNGDLDTVTIPDTDVIVVQRVTEKKIVDAMRIWQDAGIRVVVDMDDNMRDITPGQNPGAFKTLHKMGAAIGHQWSAVACDIADHVTVSTDALERFYRADTVLRNCIPAAYLEIARSPVTNLIGWTGAIRFRQDDPSVLGGTIPRLEKLGYAFGMVGHDTDVVSAFKLTKPLAMWGATPMHLYPLAVSQFTVGIAPLKPNRFNESKSWLKALEYLSVGVPCVVSDMPEYRHLSRYADQPLNPPVMYASSVRQWYHYLLTMLTDEVRREDMSEAGRVLASRLTYEEHAGRWWEAWTGEST